MLILFYLKTPIKAGEESFKNHWIDKGIGLIDSTVIVLAQVTCSSIFLTKDCKIYREFYKF